MKKLNKPAQQGAVLLVALVMLLVLTALAITSMRNVTLEARITGNRVESARLQTSADAALRESEYRLLYTHCKYRSHFDPVPSTCTSSNNLQLGTERKPCLIEASNETQLKNIVENPRALSNATKSTMLTSTAASGDIWMPYTGLDTSNQTAASRNASWNAMRAYDGSQESQSINPEYGNAAEAIGTFYYLNNGISGDIATQSVVAKIFVDSNFCD